MSDGNLNFLFYIKSILYPILFIHFDSFEIQLRSLLAKLPLYYSTLTNSEYFLNVLRMKSSNIFTSSFSLPNKNITKSEIKTQFKKTNKDLSCSFYVKPWNVSGQMTLLKSETNMYRI